MFIIPKEVSLNMTLYLIETLLILQIMCMLLLSFICLLTVSFNKP